MEKYHDYYAFVSHRSPDKPLAEWLQKKLEQYVVPGNFRKALGMRTRRIMNICVDKNSFARGILKAEINDKLEKSDKLIVLCSTTSAAPVPGKEDWTGYADQVNWIEKPSATGWIGYEVEYFMNLKNPDGSFKHSEKDLILVVTDGDPIEKKDCFHPCLKSKYIDNDRLKYIDFRGNYAKNRRLFLELVAAVIGVEDLDQFIDRDKRRRMIKRVEAIAASVAAIAALIFTIDYFVPHSAHYRDYVIENGLPVGMERIGKSDYSKEVDHYVITITKATKAIRLEHVNSVLTPVEDNGIQHVDAPMIAVYTCRTNGRVDTVEYLDRNENVQITYAYSTDLRVVRFQENNFSSTQVYPAIEKNEYGIPTHLKIDSYELTYDEYGRYSRRMYLSGVNYVIDESGVAGEEYIYDNNGHLASVRYLNRAGNRTVNRNGVSGLVLNYDDNGKCISHSFVNLDDKPFVGPELYATAEIQWENGTNRSIMVYKDTHGGRVVNQEGFSKKICEYDSTTHMLIKETYFGVNDEPVFSTEGYHGIDYVRNSLGDVEIETYIGIEGDPVENNEGYARAERQCDASGNELRVSYFNSNSNPVALADYAASKEQIIDDDGYIIDQRYFDANGRPVNTKDGYYHKSITLDDGKRPIEISYYGSNEEAVYCAEGYHQLFFEYDKLGNMIKLSVYGTEGQLIPFDGSWAVKELRYNGGGYITDEKLYDQYGKTVMGRRQYASLQNEYDDRGLLLTTSFYDENGELKDGVSGVAASDRIIIGSRYYARIKFEYDEDGRVTECRVYDEDGEPLDSSLGYAAWRAEYDDYGREIKREWYNEDGKPYQRCAYLTREYDVYGNEVGSVRLLPDGSPALLYTQDGLQYSATKREFDECRHEISTSYYRGSELVRSISREFNENGLMIKEIYVDSNNVPVATEDGNAGKITEYDEQRRVLFQAYVMGTSMENLSYAKSNNEGFSKQEYEYNDEQRETTITYYDSNGKMVCNNYGFSRLTEMVDERRNTIRADFYYSDGGLLFSFVNSYNERGQISTKAVYRADGGLLAVRGTYHVAMIENSYDEYGNQTGCTIYGEDGKPILLGKYAAWASEYNEQNRESSRKYFGTDGNGVNIDEGFSEARFEYDEFGREVRRSFYDNSGMPVNTIFGFAGYEVNYSENGDIADCRYFDKNGGSISIDNGDVEIATLMIGGDYEIKNSYSETGESTEVLRAENTLSIKRLCYISDNNKYDLLLQPFISIGNNILISEYAEKAKKYYTPNVAEGEEQDSAAAGIDLSGYEEKDIWHNVIKAYVNSIEKNDGDNLLKLINIEYNAITADYYKYMLGYGPSEEELTEFYCDFYVRELNSLHEELIEAYGDSYTISWTITDLQETSRKIIESTNAQLQAMAVGENSAPILEENVTFTISYTISGVEKTGHINTGYLYPELILQKIDGKWLIGSSSGFPSIPNDELKKFLQEGN